MSQKGLITQVDVINITFKKEIELMCTKCTQLIWRLKKKTKQNKKNPYTTYFFLYEKVQLRFF